MDKTFPPCTIAEGTDAYYICPKDSYTVAAVHRAHVDKAHTEEELEAWATLFAAAPDLLEALEAIQRELPRLAGTIDEGWPGDSKAILLVESLDAIARAAIAKARGELGGETHG